MYFLHCVKSKSMRHQSILLCIIATLGIGVRLALAIHQPADLTADNDGYLAHAHPIADGEGFAGPYSHRPTAFRPPAYPILLGAFIGCGLTDAAATAIISLASCGILFWFTYKLAEQCQLPSTFVLLASAGVALDPLLVRYSVLPMTEVPCAAVLVVAVVFFRSARIQATSDFGRATWSAIVAGVMFGTGSLMRPVVLVSCAFLSFAALFRSETNGLSFKERSLKNHALALLPAIVAAMTLSPWIVRNAIQLHHFVPATTHGGYTLALGNNPDFYRDVIHGNDAFPWDGEALDAWQQRMIRQAKDAGVPTADEPATDAWYYTQARAAIQADPASFLIACALRLRRFWAISTAEEAPGKLVSISVAVWYLLIWTGLFVERYAAWALRKTERHPSLADLWLVALSFMLMHTVYWTDTRMRAPLMPILIVISLSGWRFIFESIIVRNPIRQSTNLVSS